MDTRGDLGNLCQAQRIGHSVCVLMANRASKLLACKTGLLLDTLAATQPPQIPCRRSQSLSLRRAAGSWLANGSASIKANVVSPEISSA